MDDEDDPRHDYLKKWLLLKNFCLNYKFVQIEPAVILFFVFEPHNFYLCFS